MRRRIAVAALACLATATGVSPAAAHQGNPNFRSGVESITPPDAGVEAEVLNLDDRLIVRSDPGHTLVVSGYDDEPYLRILPNGSVQVNTRSPAHYLNADRFAGADVPGSADPSAAPAWRTVASGGSYEWHDHRIHWMAQTTPPQVADEGKRTKVFDWSVPIAVDGEPGAITGELYWEPDESGFPVAAIVALVVFAVASVALVAVVRRRRAGNRRSGGETEA